MSYLRLFGRVVSRRSRVVNSHRFRRLPKTGGPSRPRAAAANSYRHSPWQEPHLGRGGYLPPGLSNSQRKWGIGVFDGATDAG